MASRIHPYYYPLRGPSGEDSATHALHAVHPPPTPPPLPPLVLVAGSVLAVVASSQRRYLADGPLKTPIANPRTTCVGPLSATPGRGLTRQNCTSHRRPRVVLCYDTVRPQLDAVPCSFFICTSPWALLISTTSNGSVGSMQATKRPASPKIRHSMPAHCKLVPADGGM